MEPDIGNPNYWRERAAQARRSAVRMKDKRVRDALDTLAQSYELMAHRVEERAGKDGSSQ